MLYSRPLLVIYFMYSSVYMSLQDVCEILKSSLEREARGPSLGAQAMTTW